MKTISAGHVAAFGLWAIGLVLVVAWMVDETMRTGGLGLMFAGAGGVLNIRVFILEMEDRERRAFDFGRQVGAASNEGTPRIH